ncbi:GMC oxidoreductase [Rickenella mellea]|uniref:GMC oxidoreductase n=1 Tax=Rickenella mellea TaxID=50990 RepID=A0A4Y7Q162_9AGAM|nr:GMC oxidoreductase [Rickenella mellea]
MSTHSTLSGINDIAHKAFDYVIIGGGTAGLCLAARLSEDPTISVAVLEAGNAYIRHPVTSVPGLMAKYLNDPNYDWCFKTVPQKHANGSQIGFNRGKCLGGTSSINSSLWHRPHKDEIDAWEKLGNPGWSWTRFSEYCKKSERLSIPTQDMVEKYRQLFDPVSHGENGDNSFVVCLKHIYGSPGPVPIMFPVKVSEYDMPVQKALNGLGVPTLTDPANGEVSGTFQTTLSLHKDNITRVSSVTAYYLPNAHRSNLSVLTGAHGVKILTTKSNQHGEVSSTGVEFLHSGQRHVVKANKEVILSAGTINTPQILELSGIGDPRILSPLGITAEVDLPGVGRNIQDHISYAVSFELVDDFKWETMDAMRDPKFAAEQVKLHAQQKGLLTMSAAGLTFAPLQIIAPERFDELTELAQNIASKAPPELKEQYDIQVNRLRDKSLPNCEIGLFPGFWSAPNPPKPGKRYLTLVAILSHPFSRGTIHINSNSAETPPAIDPHFLEESLDLEILLETVKFMRRLPQTDALKTLISGELNPGPRIQTDDQLRETIKGNIKSIWHTCGSASMLPRDKGGVVDSNLRVWGTQNLRVVDLSVVPLIPLAHTQATAYAIAEQGIYLHHKHPYLNFPHSVILAAAEIIKLSNTSKGRL